MSPGEPRQICMPLKHVSIRFYFFPDENTPSWTFASEDQPYLIADLTSPDAVRTFNVYNDSQCLRVTNPEIILRNAPLKSLNPRHPTAKDILK